MSEVCLIVAIGPDNIIGIKDKLAWHSIPDFEHFKNTTKGSACIFGKTTFFGLPKYPLKNRLNVVLDIDNPGTFIRTTENQGSWLETSTFDNALNLTKHYSKVFICGGASVYRYALENNLVDTIYLSEIKADVPHDEAYIRFPIDLNVYCETGWQKEEIIYKEYTHDTSVKFYKYTKIK